MNSEPVVLITGTASGLGKQLAQTFLHAGWKVARGNRVNAGIQLGSRELQFPMNVTSGSEVNEGMRLVKNEWGKIDVLINNAGVADDGLLVSLTEESWNRIIDVNTKGAFLVTKSAIALFPNEGGSIINIGSYAGLAGAAGQCNYAAAKAGLIGLTKSLAAELGTQNIRCNAVLPGVLPTRMTETSGQTNLLRLQRANALNRINSLEEVSNFILHLSTMKNVSGQVFQLDSRINSWT